MHFVRRTVAVHECLLMIITSSFGLNMTCVRTSKTSTISILGDQNRTWNSQAFSFLVNVSEGTYPKLKLPSLPHAPNSFMKIRVGENNNTRTTIFDGSGTRLYYDSTPGILTYGHYCFFCLKWNLTENHMSLFLAKESHWSLVTEISHPMDPIRNIFLQTIGGDGHWVLFLPESDEEIKNDCVNFVFGESDSSVDYVDSVSLDESCDQGPKQSFIVNNANTGSTDPFGSSEDSAITTQAPCESSDGCTLTCVCEKNYTTTEMDDMINEIRQSHTYSRTTWSRYVRSKMSATDDRYSSKAGGCLAVVILVLLSVCFPVIDALNIKLKQSRRGERKKTTKNVSMDSSA